MKKVKTLFNRIQKFFSSFIEKTFSSRKNTLKFLAYFIFTVLFLIEISNILIRNSFYNNGSDDVLQYYTSMVDFISALKDGSLSWFNLNNYLGASFFSDVYYVPLDIFTTTTFFLSYLMPIGLAYSVTELFKIFLGVMLFAYYLSLSNMKNRTIFWMGILYFISGGTVSFMAFPVFLSLTVYMPLALIVVHFFVKKKIRWIVPLFALISIFYDFYLGYTVLAFSCFAFVLEYAKQPGFKFFIFVKELCLFVLLLLLGVLMSAIIAYPAITFILEETYRATSTFEGWVVYEGLNVLGHEIDVTFFQPEVYIRMLAKMFVEQRPVGFYGFTNSYALEHISLYISVIGLAYMNYVLFMKDRISRIYKVAILVALIFMWFPLFSYIFSGTLDMPYTRWINMLPIFQLVILSHVFDKFGFEKIDMRKMTVIVVVLIGVIGFLIYYYTSRVFGEDYLASREILSTDRILMFVAAGYLILFLIFGWLKKWNVVKFFLWLEIIAAGTYMFMGSFFIQNKIDIFDNAIQIDEYLDSVLVEDDEFYRVYVDINNLGVEDLNFNRMTGYATNTNIFHSWTDSETNGISYLLYGSKEYQSKYKMNAFAYYLNHLLGYKYLLVDSGSNIDFDNEYFSLYSSNGVYNLYEVLNVTSFKVYDTYLSEEDFISFRNSSSTISKQRVFVDTAVIDVERYLLNGYEFEEYDLEEKTNDVSVRPYQMVYLLEEENVHGVVDETVRDFYKYDISDYSIDFKYGSIYIDTMSVTLDESTEIFMKYNDGTDKVCSIMNDKTYDIKCDFTDQAEYLYVEKTESLESAPSLKYRTEAAINGAAYLVYDMSDLDISIDSGIMNLRVSNQLAIEKGFIIDESGNRYDLVDSFYSFTSKPDKLYLFKTNKMYERSNLYSLLLYTSYESLDDSLNYIHNNDITSQSLVIENGKIELSYVTDSNSGLDQIVMIPICYSDDWVFSDGNDYETLSVNGGFLGIIIPNGETNIDISMKFIPKGLDLGALASFCGLAIYLGLFVPNWLKRIKKKKNGVDVL